ncbi:MAG: hypothetical protein K5744_02945 [Eubacterium sp.]|nr:hypothetical protein [Eubacterium sp.]
MMETEKEEKRIRIERKIEEQEDTIWRIDQTLRGLEEHNQQAISYMNSAAALCQPSDLLYDRIMNTIQNTHRIFVDGREALQKEKRCLRDCIDEAEFMKKSLNQ